MATRENESPGMAYLIFKKDDDGPTTLAMLGKGFGRPRKRPKGMGNTTVVEFSGRWGKSSRHSVYGIQSSTRLPLIFGDWVAATRTTRTPPTGGAITLATIDPHQQINQPDSIRHRMILSGLARLKLADEMQC